MRKYLMIVLISILIILAYFTVRDGINIGSFKIISWNELIKNNQKLDERISDLERLSSVSYPQQQTQLNDSYKKLLSKKEEYADLVLYSSETEIAAATQTEIYETEFLWTKIGNYATKNNGIDMKIDVVKGSSGIKNQYNLNFTLIGEYAYISDFISSLENDAKLSFKIENFLLVPAVKQSNSENKNSHLLQATFTVQNVGINIDAETAKNVTNNSNDENSSKTNKNNTTNSNTSKNTNTTT